MPRRASPVAQQHAKILRQDSSRAERDLWSYLRRGQLGGAHFRRQHPLGPFVVDFVCVSVKLAIEIDGDSHVDRDAYDAQRTAWLEQELGYRVLRFTNEEVLQHIEGVLQMLNDAVNGPPL